MGFGVVQLNAGLVHLGVLNQSSLFFQCVIIILVSSVAIASAVAGVNMGVKRLSEINLSMSVLLMIFVLSVGPNALLHADKLDIWSFLFSNTLYFKPIK